MKKILVIIFFLAITFPLLSQWQQCNGFYGGNVTALAVSGNKIFAATYGGVYFSTDNGNSWIQKNNGLKDLWINSIAIKGNYIFVTTLTGIYLSTDNGDNWVKKNNGLTFLSINSITIDVDYIFVGAGNGAIFLSSNNGDSWIKKNNGFNLSSYITALVTSNNNIFAAASDGVYMSNDNAATWVPKNNGLGDIYITALTVNGNNVLAGTSQGNIYLSTNNGDNWNKIYSGTSDAWVNYINTSGNNIYTAINMRGIYFSSDYGNTWIQKGSGWDFYHINSLTIIGNNIWACSASKGILFSMDSGNNWTKKNNGFSISEIRAIAFSGNNIFVGTGEAVFLSTNGGLNWSQKWNGLSSFNIISLKINGNYIFAGTNLGIFISTDNGDNWTQKNNGLTNTIIESIAISGNNVFAGTDGGVFLTTDKGESWVPKFNGLPEKIISVITISGNNIFVGTAEYPLGHIYLSTDNGNNWAVKGESRINKRVWSIAIDGSNIFAGVDNDGVYFSTDNGDNWIQKKCGLPYYNSIFSISITGNNIFAGNYGTREGESIYLSTNKGDNWNDISNFETFSPLLSLDIDGNDIYAGTQGSSIWKANITQLINSIFTISLNSVNTSYCTGDTIFIPYNVKGNFNKGNVFTAQLSDSFGSFFYPTDIGSINSTVAGTITAIISDSIPQRNNYRIRVVSSNPQFNGRDNCFDISITQKPNPIITSGDSNVCYNSIVTYQTNVKPGVTCQWSVSGGALQGSSTNDTVNILWNSPGNGIVKLIQANSLGCLDSIVKNIIINPLPIKPVITHLQNKLQSTLAMSYQWFYGGNPIQDEVNREYIPLLPGDYTVEITDSNGCSAMSDAYIMGNGPYLLTSNNPLIFPIDCQSSSQNTLSISNGGNQDLSVIEAVIEGNNASDFQITTDLNNYLIKAKETSQITFTFKPSGIGDRSATLKLKTNAANINEDYFLITLNARKDSVGFILSTMQLDLDTLDENTPVTKNIILTNTGTVPLYWQYPDTIGEFTIESINPDTTQPNGGTSTVKITFHGGQRNTRYVRSYQFTEPVCKRSVKLDLSARVGVPAIPSTISINNGDTVRASAGDEVEFPIFISNKSVLYSSGILTVEGDVRTNSNLLYPSLGTDLGKIDSLNDRVIHLNMPIDSSQNPIIETLRFKAMLGNDSTTILALENLKGLPFNIDFTEIKNAVFILTGICRDGGARLIGPGPSASIVINPNPVSSTCKIEYETYSGYTKLYIVNSYGQTVKTLVDGDISSGWHTVYYDLTNVPSGVYFVILQNETKRKAVRMDVVK
jgi:photosystem II stability/assembly factor-like uncharacterized protein